VITSQARLRSLLTTPTRSKASSGLPLSLHLQLGCFAALLCQTIGQLFLLPSLSSVFEFVGYLQAARSLTCQRELRPILKERDPPIPPPPRGRARASPSSAGAREKRKYRSLKDILSALLPHCCPMAAGEAPPRGARNITITVQASLGREEKPTRERVRSHRYHKANVSVRARRRLLGPASEPRETVGTRGRSEGSENFYSTPSGHLGAAAPETHAFILAICPLDLLLMSCCPVLRP